MCLIAWATRSSNNSCILGQVVTPSGTYGAQPAIDLFAMEQDYSAACFDGEHVVSVWQDNTITYPTIYGARLGTDGTSLDSAGVALHTMADPNIATPAIAWNGTDFLLVWAESSSSNYVNIWGELLNRDLTAAGSPFSISVASGSQSNPAVASNGSSFLVSLDGRTGGQNVEWLCRKRHIWGANLIHRSDQVACYMHRHQLLGQCR